MDILVDESDLWILTRYSWWRHKGKNTYYARARVDTQLIYLHRYLLLPPAGKVVDHINGNGLDNRRNNLRIVTISVNSHNMGARIYPKGVRLHRGLYRAVFTHPLLGYKIILDSFLSPEEAHTCYCKYVKENYPQYVDILLPARLICTERE